MLIRFPTSPIQRQSQSRSGWTLMEMMVAMVLGIIIMGALVQTAINLSRSMVAISNYCQLDNDTRHTLDIMSRDIRNASTLTSFASNSISMNGTDIGGNPYSFSYTWDGANVWRSFTLTNNTTTSLMLSNCNYLVFSNYMRVPYSNFTFYADTGTNETKLISVSWRCTRSILGSKLNTESMQTAKIVIRN